MTAADLNQLQLLAEVEDLMARLNAWCARTSPWEPLQRAQALLRRVLERMDRVRQRVQAPLVVATFGGTGVGKSSLVNALVGKEVAVVGRERPTTTQPILMAHPDTDLSLVGLPLDELRVVRCDTPLLRDLLLIDCPDPDTTEAEEVGANVEAPHGDKSVASPSPSVGLTSDSRSPATNLDRLRRIVPHCDVLLCVSTQEKYRSARVGEELVQAAEGCKIVYVQTRADLDDDIRDDWRRQLDPHFRVGEMFYVDSRSALAEQRSGSRPSGEFGRLLDLFARELSMRQRVRIRRDNLFSLVHEALNRIVHDLAEPLKRVEELKDALNQQLKRLVEKLKKLCTDELLVNRGLWERRVLGQVTQHWGLSPFALLLRAWHGQSSLISSLALLRVRSASQLVLWGVFEGTRRWSSRQQESAGEQHVERLAQLELSESDLLELRFVLKGALRSAEMKPEVADELLEQLRQSVEHAETEFWTRVQAKLDARIAAAAKRHSTWLVRWGYETGFALLPLWLLYRVGKNFFYDSWIRELPLLESHFYIPAVLFLALWCVLWLMLFARRLRGGLEHHVHSLAEELAQDRLGSLFPEVEQHCSDFQDRVDELNKLNERVACVVQQANESSGLSAAHSVGHAHTGDPARQPACETQRPAPQHSRT